MSARSNRKVTDKVSASRIAYSELPPLLGLKQAAAYAERSYWLFYQAVRSGQIPHRRIGKLYFIEKEYFAPAVKPEPSALVKPPSAPPSAPVKPRSAKRILNEIAAAVMKELQRREAGA